MSALEDQLGTPLFERGPGGATLTELGTKLAQHAEGMEERAFALLAESLGHERAVEGSVRLALTESIAVHALIPRVLPGLYERHPKLTLTLLTSDEVADLGHRRAEIALRFFRPKSGDLVTKRVATMKTALIAHTRFRRTPLARLPLVTVAHDHVPSPESEYLKRNVAHAPRLSVSSYVGQIEAVRAGLGAAVLVRSTRGLTPALVELDRGLPPSPPLELWLVVPRSLRQVPRIDAVWSALEEGLAFLDDG